VPQVIFEYFTQTNNHPINQNFTDWTMTKTSGDFPGTPYAITAAQIVFTHITANTVANALEVYSNSPGVNQQLLVTGPLSSSAWGGLSGGDTHYYNVTYPLTTSANYPALTKVNLRSLKGNLSEAGLIFRLRSSSYIRVIVTYELTTTPCTAPSALSVTPTTSEGNATLTWNAGAGGVGNAFSYYEIQHRDSSDNASWGGWNATGTSSATNLSVPPPGTRSYYRQFQARTVGAAGAGYASGWVTSSNTLRKQPATAPSTPTSVTISASLSESNITLSWGASGDGYGNTVSTYYVYAEDSADGFSWGAGAHILTTTTVSGVSVPINATRGQFRRYLVYAIGSGGMNSGAGYSSSVKKNSLPTAPTLASASPTVYNSGNVSLSWSGATDPDNNISNYTIEIATSTDGGSSFEAWSTVTTSSTTSYSYSPSLESKVVAKWRIRTNDALGASSGYTETNTIVKNSPPNTPTLITPTNNAIIYTDRPYLRISCPVEPDGDSQTLQISIDGGAYTTLATVGASATDSWYQCPTLAVGAHTLTIRLVDSKSIAGPSVSGTMSRAALPAWTDASLVANETMVKAIHMEELRARANVVCMFYGVAQIAPFNISTNFTSLSQWGSHINLVRTALNTCLTTSGRSAKTWTDGPQQKITAVAMNEVRNSIPTI